MSKKEPILTILIPAYNAEKFLPISIPSILNEHVFEENLLDTFEVIIIDDGSKDNTFQYAKEYANIWNKKTNNPNLVQVVRKKNGQYGSVINRGIKMAKGHYIKILDVDDHFKINEFIDFLYILHGINDDVDVIISDFIYEKVGTNKTYKWTFNNKFHNSRIINLYKTSFPKEIITMHSLTYRTNLLREMNYKQIENVYYSDSQYALSPLQFAKKYYYTNACVYGYYIGRNDQSININVMIKNIKDQEIVVKTILNEINLDIVKNKVILKYLIRNLRAMIQWQILLIVKDPKINKKKKQIFKLIKFVKKTQPKYANKIMNNTLFWVITITRGYGVPFLVKIAFKIYTFFRNNIFAD